MSFLKVFRAFFLFQSQFQSLFRSQFQSQFQSLSQLIRGNTGSKVSRGLFLLSMCILLGACGTRTSSSANSGANVDICIGADKPENSFWKELLADGDDEAGDEEGADAQCHWECNEGFTEYAEEC